jgi:hypothetical protein
MSKPIVLNRDRAKHNPESAFGHPHDVVDHVLLTYAEKRTILERWRLGILHELAATGEGMATHGLSARRLDVLGAVEAAKADLERSHHSR